MNILDFFTEFGSSLVWPLVVILIGLVVLREAGEELRPIFVSIIGGVAKSASANATAYAIAMLFGLSASLSAFVDVFHALTKEGLAAMSWHQYLSLWAKVLNPFIVAVLAYATQNKFKGAGSTSAPFPASSQ